MAKFGDALFKELLDVAKEDIRRREVVEQHYDLMLVCPIEDTWHKWEPVCVDDKLCLCPCSGSLVILRRLAELGVFFVNEEVVGNGYRQKVVRRGRGAPWSGHRTPPDRGLLEIWTSRGRMACVGRTSRSDRRGIANLNSFRTADLDMILNVASSAPNKEHWRPIMS
eukprot:s1636_g8.t3